MPNTPKEELKPMTFEAWDATYDYSKEACLYPTAFNAWHARDPEVSALSARIAKLEWVLKLSNKALEMYQKAGRLQGSSDKDLGYAIADKLYYRDEAQAELATREALAAISHLLQPSGAKEKL